MLTYGSDFRRKSAVSLFTTHLIVSPCQNQNQNQNPFVIVQSSTTKFVLAALEKQCKKQRQQKFKKCKRH